MKKRKGVSLIVLIITIIVVIILAAAVILALSKDGGIINQARFAKDEYNKIEYRDRINEAYTIVKNKQEMQGKPDREIFEEVKKSLNFEKAKYEICDKSMNITTKEGYEYTILGDGYIYDEKVVVLDIAEGNIDLYSNGYKQYTGALQGLNQNGATSFTGKYIITGTTTENVVRVCDVGNYNITIKDLDIDVSSKNNIVAFLAGNKNSGLYVKIDIEGNNKLYSKSSALSWSGVTQEVGGSELEIYGEGKLELWCANNRSEACIGGNNARNITINSGTIYAIRKGENYGYPIGGKNANITINGGNIFASSGKSEALYGDKITINGGLINASGGEYGIAIAAEKKLLITGGCIECLGTFKVFPLIGGKCKDVMISGGTIITSLNRNIGLSCGMDDGKISITGGNLFLNGKMYRIAKYVDAWNTDTNKKMTPTNGTNEIYLTSIKLQNIGENKKIESITTSDNIAYGIKDTYTLEDGMLYLYLPLGKREITIKVDGKTFKGEVETTENENNKVLNEE